MLGDVASRIGLDEEVEVALVFIGGDGRVRADDFLRLSGDGSGERNVLADREAEDVGFAWKLEPVTRRSARWPFEGWGCIHGGVVRENSLLLELKLLEIGRLQYLARSYSHTSALSSLTCAGTSYRRCILSILQQVLSTTQRMIAQP
jgi:hypothetical protein